MIDRAEIMRKAAEQELSEAWPEWEIVDILGQGAYGEVYKICKTGIGGTSQSALKIIRVDETCNSPVKIDNSDENAVLQDFIHNVRNEIDIMEFLKGAPNILVIEDHKILSDGQKCSVLIRMELAENLTTFLKKRDRLSLDVILKVGIDVCQALEYCERSNIIHRDIKESNLFYNKKLDMFKLGDFGVSRTLDVFKNSEPMTGIGTISYMAPEVFGGKDYDRTVDIYSLGIVLYTLLNYGRLPFCSIDTRQLSITDVQKANHMRLSGEVVPFPKNADNNLAVIICKACAADPKTRYQSAGALKKDLIAYRDRVEKTDLETELKIKVDTAASAEGANREETHHNADQHKAALSEKTRDYKKSGSRLTSEEGGSNSKSVIWKNLLDKRKTPAGVMAAILIITVGLAIGGGKKPVEGGSFDFMSCAAKASFSEVSSGNDINNAINELKGTAEETFYDMLLTPREYICEMKLPSGLNVGKYVIVKNNSNKTLDLRGDFVFLDDSGLEIDHGSYVDYAVAPDHEGILFQQSDLPDIQEIQCSVKAAESMYIPVTDCITWTAEDKGEEGVVINVKNETIHDIKDFRVRILWFDKEENLETVAFRWSNDSDHILKSGEEHRLSFSRKWGYESYSLFFQGFVEQ